MSNQLVEIRMKRGQEIFQKGATITKIDNTTYNINSLTSNSVYEINVFENRFVCSCPDFQYREVELCKHIACLQIWISTNNKVKEKPKVFADDAIKCDECGSIRIIKYGFDCGKQTYYCKDCHKKFREYSILRKVKFTPELITLCLDLYFSGLSLRKISRNVGDHFNVDINYSTIYDWIQKYIPQISNYVNSLTPQLSDSWHADELFVKMKNGEKRKGDSRIAYLWNIMDRESRFLIVSKLSEHRDSQGAIQAFNEAIHNSHGQKPQTVYTDALKGYKEGVKQTLGNKVDHVAKCGITKPHANNNRVERLNGTLRERVKVQRGWKNPKSAIAEGQRIYYNFVKPHQALENKTPAVKAGIKIQEKNKLLNLLDSTLNGNMSIS